MRKLLLAALALCLPGLLSAPEPAQADSDFKVTLLGTSSPTPRPNRFGPSTLIEAGDQKLLIDAGRGVPIRMWQLRIPLGKIDALFLTHYHSDHTSGIPDVWLTGWLAPPFGQRKTAFHVIGPVGAKNLMDNLQKAYADDIKTRIADEKLPAEAIAVRVDEFDKDGVVYEKNGVKVIAFTNHHGDLIHPSVGYRIEYKGHVAVLSGDTAYNENVIKQATGADLLVHEVALANPELMKLPAIQRIIAHHTTPQEAGKVFALAKPKMAAYSHISLQGNAYFPEPTIAELVSETRKTYSGALEVGEDLMSFEIGDTGVTVQRFKQ